MHAALRDWSGQNPLPYPDPDVVALDPRFKRCIVGNTPLLRLFTGALWAEGPAWNAVGRYLVWSDTPGNVMRRWLEDDGHVSVFRSPANYPNGNTFDAQGRLLTCEHGARHILRREHDGSETVIANSYQGKPFNSPNDLAVHPDGSIWFSDPDYGIRGNYEGYQAEPQLSMTRKPARRSPLMVFAAIARETCGWRRDPMCRFSALTASASVSSVYRKPVQTFVSAVRATIGCSSRQANRCMHFTWGPPAHSCHNLPATFYASAARLRRAAV